MICCLLLDLIDVGVQSELDPAVPMLPLLDQLEDITVSQCPRVSLAMTHFTFARADKGQRLSHFEGSTVDELETFVGKGKVIVLPILASNVNCTT